MTERTVVKVPRAPGNLLFGIYFGLGVWAVFLSFACAMHFALAPRIDLGFPTAAGLAVAIVLVLHFAWLRYVRRGRAWAMILVCILYAPVTYAGLAGVYFWVSSLFPYPMRARLGEWGFWSLAIGAGALVLFLLVTNLCEPGLGAWLRLDGRCPQCREWRLGRVKKGQATRCPVCNTELVFQPAN